jgi:CBS domain-containing protein
VEDERGRLIGLVSHRDLLHLVVQSTSSPCTPDNLASSAPGTGACRTVASLMRGSPITVSPETTTLEALRLMCDHDVDCLLVVEGGRLVGLVAERDLLHAATRLLEGYLRDG